MFVGRADVRRMAADRHRWGEWSDAMADFKARAGREGFEFPPMSWLGTGRGQHADGSYGVRAFQYAALSGRLYVDAHDDLLTNAVRGSRLVFDARLNPALDRRERVARIDGVQAAVLAVGLAGRAGYLRMASDPVGSGGGKGTVF